ncbi:MAG: Tad domain-containing protein, partial [Acidimicrobiia bacterium]|nr:Tad domain-containing protein [Acidimicrobiia bacterium]
MSMIQILKRQEGATAVLVASMMFLLMGVAALVIDIGAGYSERRLDQTVADTAVMGGSVVAVEASSIAAGVAEVKRLVDVNLNRTVTAAQWTACQDPDKYSLEPDPTTECISVDLQADQMTLRVQIPRQAVPTSFGRVLGVNQLNTSAAAEATLYSDGGGGVLPFGLFPGPSGSEACLKDTSGSGLPPPCDGPDTGQFGPFSVYKYAPGPSRCNSTNNVFIYSVGRGVDHNMTSFEPDYAGGAGVGPGNQVSVEGCTASVPSLLPNSVRGDTGNKVPLIEKGLLGPGPMTYVGVTFNGRLESTTGTTAVIDLSGPGSSQIDSTPLWTWFITNPAVSPYGANCANLVGVQPTLDTKKTVMKTCIAGWGPGDGAIFSTGLINHPRFAFVPEYDETVYSPAGTYHINQFRPV